jgi:hypothetical protein
VPSVVDVGAQCVDRAALLAGNAVQRVPRRIFEVQGGGVAAVADSAESSSG